MIGYGCRAELAPWTVGWLLQSAAETLATAGVDTPILDAEVILSRAIGCSRVDLLSHPGLVPSDKAIEKFMQGVDRRTEREPLAYIIGEREFYGICFEVDRSVLVPRPETEVLVDTAIQFLRNLRCPAVADIGVGSGAVAVSIAKNVPDAVVYGTDLSASALEVARRNAELAGVQERMHFLEGDLYAPLDDMSFDLIVSNPPYIPTGEIDSLEPEIAKYEPREALDGGPDGMDCHRRLTSAAPEYLKCGGALALEVGAGQSSAVGELFRANGFKDVRAVPDYGGIERVVFGELADEDFAPAS